MSNLNIWLRKKQKLLIAILCIFLMVAWFGGSALLQALRKEPVKGGKVFSDTVSGREFSNRASQLYRFYRGGRLNQALVEALTWEIIILEKEAENHGITVSNADIVRYLEARFPATSGRGIDQAAYQATLRTLSMTTEEFENVTRWQLTTRFLKESVTDNVTLPREEAWLWYRYDNEKVKTRYLRIGAEELMPFVSATEEELKQFYTAHKDTAPSPASTMPWEVERKAVPGYLEPEKIVIEYIMAPYDHFAEIAEITPAQINEYYEANKQDFPLPPKDLEEDENQKDDADKQEGEELEAKAPEEPVEEQPEEGQEAKGADETSAKEADSATTEAKPEPAYKPLAKVKGEIIQKLLDAEGKRKAKETIDKVNDDIFAIYEQAYGKDEAVDIDLMALRERYGLLHRKTRLFSKEESKEILPGAYALPKKAFGRASTDIKVPKSPLTADEGIFIFQILKSVRPEPALYEAVRERVEEDYRLEKSYDLAREIARTAAIESNLDAAQEVVEAALAKLLQDNAGAGKEPDVKALFTAGETPFFGKTRQRSPYDGTRSRQHRSTGLPGSHNYHRYADAAFKLKDGEVGKVDEEIAGRASFVLLRAATKSASRADFDKDEKKILESLLRQKQEAVLKTWHADLRRRAHPSTNVKERLQILPSWQDQGALENR